MKSKLKIGLLINSDVQAAWVKRMLEKILASDCAEIKLIIKKNTGAIKESPSSKLKIYFKNFWYFIYSRMDETFFKTHPSAFKLENINHLIKDAECLIVNTKSTVLSDHFFDDDLIKIKEHNLDVIIRLSGFKILRGGILHSAKCGVWSFHHGDNSVNRGGPAGFWEVFEKRSETGVVLQILTEDLDGGTIIDKSFSSTNEFSVNRNLNSHYWKALSLIPRNLIKLQLLGLEKFLVELKTKNSTPFFYSQPLYKKPESLTMLKGMASISWGVISKKISDIFWLKQWILLYNLNKNGEVSKSFYRFKKITPPRDRFWADPFTITQYGITYVFFEELLYKNGKGHISVILIDESGKISKPVQIIETNYHMSYPFVFKDNGNYYMIPETAANKTVELYKCIDFPYKWELEKNIFQNVDAVDTTIHYHKGKYWMFVNIKENEGASTWDELFLFYAEELMTEKWQPHPMNPIVSDVKKARPAGKLFEYNGELYRPSQDCSGHYGRGMKIQKIIELNEYNYKEESVQSIYPDWDKNLISTHTINFDQRITIIDAQRKRFKFFQY